MLPGQRNVMLKLRAVPMNPDNSGQVRTGDALAVAVQRTHGTAIIETRGYKLSVSCVTIDR